MVGRTRYSSDAAMMVKRSDVEGGCDCEWDDEGSCVSYTAKEDVRATAYKEVYKGVDSCVVREEVPDQEVLRIIVLVHLGQGLSRAYRQLPICQPWEGRVHDHA